MQRAVQLNGARCHPFTRKQARRAEAAAREAASAKPTLHLAAAAPRERRQDKENMAEFLAKKREMFLVQMSLDTKRSEILKLEAQPHTCGPPDASSRASALHWRAMPTGG